ncbi:hypothetical protein HPB47_006296 [Ixodes persulcatus]|uniref:Uncharacterized protein n=1 Tax=Ixodes persulcatus TaxID=34615 RepID=A0AC60PAR9_IXOPE|nr:hypothetical protein HPB47_006296 [Ixodes persulcatus]
MPPPSQFFVFSAPAEVPVDEIIDSVYRLVGEDSWTHLQQFGAMKFLAAVGSTAAADKMAAQGHLLRNVVVPLEQVRPRIIHVTVFRLPPYFPDDAFQAVFSSYGKVLAISHQTYKDRPKLFTGTRVLRMEMKTPMPNFVNVGGHRVTCEYRGMKVCARCGLEGHFGPACRTPRCNRCGVFGHGTDGCNAPCKCCAHIHATTHCTQRQSFAAVIRDEGPSDPRHPPLTAPPPPPPTELRVLPPACRDPPARRRDPTGRSPGTTSRAFGGQEARRPRLGSRVPPPPPLSSTSRQKASRPQTQKPRPEQPPPPPRQATKV